MLPTLQMPFRWLSRTRRPESFARLLLAGCALPEPAPRKVPGTWLLSRGLYRVRCFNLPQVPPAERAAAARHLVLAWQPFDRPEHRLVTRGEAVLAFAWDADAVQGLLREGGASPEAMLWPESLLREPQDQGVRVIHALEGVEAQCWRDGMLTASRWWRGDPTQDEWSSFLRQSGQDATLSYDACRADPAWRGSPWAELRRPEVAGRTWSRQEQLFVGASAMALVAMTAGQAHEWWAAQQTLHGLRAERDRVRAAAAPVIALRDKALSDVTAVEQLTKALDAPQPIEVMDHLSAVLPRQGAVMREFALNDLHLRVNLDLAPSVSRSAIVSALQSGGWFKDVTEARDASSSKAGVAFDMALSGTRPPVLPPRPRNIPSPIVATPPAASAAGAEEAAPVLPPPRPRRKPAANATDAGDGSAAAPATPPRRPPRPPRRAPPAPAEGQ
jgi:hypothetical protein